MEDGLIFISWQSRKEDMMNIASCGGSYDVDAVADEYYAWLKSVHGKYASFDFEPMPQEDEDYMNNYIQGMFEEEE